MDFVSICLPSWNGVEVLPDCLESILNQKYKDWEAIVVNDGSDDSTQNIIDFYAKKDKRIKGIQIEHSGISVARQTGVNNAKGKYIAVMDTDCQMEPNRLKEQLKRIQKDKSDICYSDYLITLANNQIGYAKSGDIKGKKVKDILDRKYPNSNQIVPNFTILAKKECFKNVYRPKYKVNDDLILIIEWLKRGYKFSYIENPLVIHTNTGYNVSTKQYKEVLKITEQIRKEEGI